MSSTPIALIQTGLRDLGHDPGPVDGLFGTMTADAAAAWLAAGGKAAGAAIRPQTTAMIWQGSARHPVREVIVHCTATRPDWMAGRPLAEKRAEVRRWHMQERGWMDIGYHWLIDRDGKIAAGRPETVIGAHVEGHNSGTIGISLIGGADSAASDPFSRHFTPAQDISLRQLLQGIGMRTQITTISGHNDYAAKACPGFSVSQWLKEA
ncbi:N-acetylmuramoyl-L-alanine amidase [Paracoccaceae bacterium Fryx2]|nr:N-acetylmuramoyl-L-alanine amidase [Paracoccaceae bacterium Fryx2]